jgi:hypothetical protein
MRARANGDSRLEIGQELMEFLSKWVLVEGVAHTVVQLLRPAQEVSHWLSVKFESRLPPRDRSVKVSLPRAYSCQAKPRLSRAHRCTASSVWAAVTIDYFQCVLFGPLIVA